jgi:hypothetical protein
MDIVFDAIVISRKERESCKKASTVCMRWPGE